MPARWLVGGGTLASAFRAEGLVSEYIVAVVPVILGAGIPLFAGAAPPAYLSLVESRVFAMASCRCITYEAARLDIVDL